MGDNKRFEPGNMSKEPTIRKSERPIEKGKIDVEILNFIYGKLHPDTERGLRNSDFKITFLCSGESVVFIKIMSRIIVPDLKLTGDDAKRFVELIDNTKLW